MEDNTIISQEDEMLLTGFGYDHSMDMQPYNYYND